MKARDYHRIAQQFDLLPDSGLVHPRVAAIVVGLSRFTVDRHPELEKVRTGPRSLGVRVRSIRRLIRAEQPAG